MQAPESNQNPFWGTGTRWRTLLCISGCALIAGMVFAGQAPPKKSVPKTPAEHSTFVCPDAEAQQACKSYQELLNAKDKSLPDDGYICFRQKMDEFFGISFTRPYFLKHWDKELKQMVSDDTPHPGFGYAQTYKDGVLDSARMPSFNFSGQWRPIPLSESGYFTSDSFNFKKQDENDSNVGVSIEENQVNVGYKYKNTFDKTMQYTLTIQRSTGRFAESIREESEKVPLLQNIGYCVSR